MEHIDQNIDIDLIDPVINVAYCSQYETGSRRIICHVLKEGKAYDIPSNIDVLLRVHKASHYNLYEKVSSIGEIDGNKIIIPLMPELTKSYGRHECIFEFVDTTEEKLLYSTKFYIRVAKSPIQNENIQDSHEYTALTDFMNTKGKANGIASLDENGKVPLEELYEATTLDKGITQLTDSILSNSITTAATPNSVKITYDAVTAEKERAAAAENDLGLNKADIASPTLTGTPKAPTASAGTSTTQIATTAFASAAVSNHNSSSAAHTDIRDLISELTTRLNALADSDDTTLDQLSEIAAYIKSNRTLIENVTTNKVNVSDIVDDLTSTAANKPLSANQGKVLKDLIDELTSTVADLDLTGDSSIATKLDTHTGNSTVHITASERNTWNTVSDKQNHYDKYTYKGSYTLQSTGRTNMGTVFYQGLTIGKTYVLILKKDYSLSNGSTASFSEEHTGYDVVTSITDNIYLIRATSDTLRWIFYVGGISGVTVTYDAAVALFD